MLMCSAIGSIVLKKRRYEQLALGVPAIEEQDYLAFFKDWHDFIEELAGKLQLRSFAVAHDVANRYRNIPDLAACPRSRGEPARSSSG